MHMVPLQVSPRAKESPNRLRRLGQVPCVIYGNIGNTLLQCDEKTLTKAFATAGESTLVELQVADRKIPALFHELAFDPVSDRVIHVDFYAVDMKKEVEAEVPLRLEGEAPAAKDLGAIIVTPLDHVSVRALPSNLPHDIPVNLASLAAFHDTITVAHLQVPSGVTIIEPPETVLVVAQQPREEEVEEVKPPEGEAVPGAEGVTAGAEGAAPATEGEVKEKTEKAAKAEKEGKEKK